MEGPAPDVRTVSRPGGLVLGQMGFGVANFIIMLVVSFIIWFLFIDPKVSLTKLYPQPFGLFLFWSILAVVFLAFCWEMWPLGGMRQPQKGVAALLLVSAIALVGIILVNLGYGSLDPVFALGDPLKAPGWTSSGMIVLMGFLIWGGFSGNWGNWPWVDAGLKQPLLGTALFLTGLGLTLPAYLILIYPNVASWARPENVLLPLATVVGWFYSVIVSCFATANTLDNWPWTSLFKSRGGRAIGSFCGNFVVGTVIYAVFLFLLKTWLIPDPAQKIIGDGINQWPAQLGVCYVLWVLVWALMFGNYPTTGRPGRDRAARFVITFVLGVLTFIIYYNGLAVNVLHEPAIAGSFGGDALTFIDWLILVLLYYVVLFESYGLKRK